MKSNYKLFELKIDICFKFQHIELRSKEKADFILHFIDVYFDIIIKNANVKRMLASNDIFVINVAPRTPLAEKAEEEEEGGN